MLGPWRAHSPTNIYDGDPYDHGLETYYYGTYSVLRNNYISGQGFVSSHLYDLYSYGFANIIDITGDTRGLEIQDVRLSGNIYRVPIQHSEQQYYLIAYHSGVNEDVQPDSQGNPIIRSTGLEIWHMHMYNGETGSYPWLGMWDLESAWGRFSDPGPPDSLAYYWQPQNEDRMSGYDNHDVWPVDEGFRWVEEIRQYPGSERDFFNIERETDEFSYRSNPNTYGQVDGSRRSPQDIENTMVIKIKQELEHSAIIDILLVAKNSIVSPQEEECVYVGEEYNISWDNEYDDALESNCRIEFTPDDGPLPVYEELARGVPVADGNYTWIPTVEQITGTGKIRVQFTP